LIELPLTTRITVKYERQQSSKRPNHDVVLFQVAFVADEWIGEGIHKIQSDGSKPALS
jgi:hypothetical protein